jgi:hypothetical protein
MPKRKPGVTPEQQAEFFRTTVRDLVAADELNPPGLTGRWIGW